MAKVPRKIINVVEEFVRDLSKEITVDKAVIFGSYIKGEYNEESDIDVAIFSDFFEGKSRPNAITYLLLKSISYDINIEPLAFTTKEYIEREGIVDEIIKTGIEINTNFEHSKTGITSYEDND